MATTDPYYDKVLYIPDLEPERSYESRGTFAKSVDELIKESTSETKIPDEYWVPARETEQTEPGDIPDSPVQLVNDLEEVKELMPQPVDSITSSIDKIVDRIKIVFWDEPEYTPPSDDRNAFTYTSQAVKPKTVVTQDDEPKLNNFNYVTTTVYDDEIKAKGIPDFFPPATNISISIELPKSLVEIAQSDYKKDTFNLNEHYLKQLQVVLQKYYQDALAAVHGCGASNIEDLLQDFDGEYVQVSDPDLEHLRDHVVRSQIARKQMSRIFKKTHNVDNTMMHMRAWHAAASERERYYSEEYGDSSTYLDSQSNSLLREARSTYDDRYSSALYNMYKYLNSSIAVIDDILSMTLKEIRAKGKLLASGVDIFASKAKEELEKRDAKIAELELQEEEAIRQAEEAAQTDQYGNAINSSSDATSSLVGSAEATASVTGGLSTSAGNETSANSLPITTTSSSGSESDSNSSKDENNSNSSASSDSSDTSSSDGNELKNVFSKIEESGKQIADFFKSIFSSSSPKKDISSISDADKKAWIQNIIQERNDLYGKMVNYLSTFYQEAERIYAEKGTDLLETYGSARSVDPSSKYMKAVAAVTKLDINAYKKDYYKTWKKDTDIINAYNEKGIDYAMQKYS